MGLAAMMANTMSQDKIFAGDKQRSGMAFNPDYKPAGDRKELRKFRIKGEEVERMKGIIDDMVRLKMIMYIDQDYNLCFLPGDKIEDLTMDETDGFVDTTGIVTSIKSKNVVEFYVENPFVKIKDE